MATLYMLAANQSLPLANVSSATSRHLANETCSLKGNQTAIMMHAERLAFDKKENVHTDMALYIIH